MVGVDDIVQVLIEKTDGMDAFGKTIKLLLDGEVVVIDGTTTPPSIHRDNIDVDVIATTSIENFKKIIGRKMNIQMAMMSGKIKVQGDMIAALPLMKML
ncbi:MAG: SCP2 sterol-binding domain-containing protein [Spongiibacteraceae bacterium]